MKPVNVSALIIFVFIVLVTTVWFAENSAESSSISFHLNAVNKLQIDEIDDAVIRIGSISLRQADGDWSNYTYLNKEIPLSELESSKDGVLLNTIQVKNRDYDMIRISFTNVSSERILNDRGISTPTSDIDIPIETPLSGNYISSILFSINAKNSLLPSPDRSSSYVFLPHIQFTAWLAESGTDIVTIPSRAQAYIQSQVHIDTNGDLRYGAPRTTVQNTLLTRPSGDSGDMQSE